MAISNHAMIALLYHRHWRIGRRVSSVVLTSHACGDFVLGAHLRFLPALLLLLACAAAYGQGNYEIQVYGADTVEPAHTMFELHSNFTADGHRAVPGGVAATHHAEHETVEITQGINNWSEVGFYIFTSEQSGLGMQWVGDHIRPVVDPDRKSTRL